MYNWRYNKLIIIYVIQIITAMEPCRRCCRTWWSIACWGRFPWRRWHRQCATAWKELEARHPLLLPFQLMKFALFLNKEKRNVLAIPAFAFIFASPRKWRTQPRTSLWLLDITVINCNRCIFIQRRRLFSARRWVYWVLQLDAVQSQVCRVDFLSMRTLFTLVTFVG